MSLEIIVFRDIGLIQMAAIPVNDDAERPCGYIYEVNLVDRRAGPGRYALARHDDYNRIPDFADYLGAAMGIPVVNHVPEGCLEKKVPWGKP